MQIDSGKNGKTIVATMHWLPNPIFLIRLINTFLRLENEYIIIPKPKNFSKIYVDYPLDSETISQIYNPDKEITKHD